MKLKVVAAPKITPVGDIGWVLEEDARLRGSVTIYKTKEEAKAEKRKLHRQHLQAVAVEEAIRVLKTHLAEPLTINP